MAYVGMSINLGHGASLVSSLVALGLLWFALPRTANSSAGIPVIFAITGLLGMGLAPIVNYYLAVNSSIVTTALGGTGVIFLGLSGYALTTRKDFSFMGGFLMTGLVVILLVAVALMAGSFFGFYMPAAHLALSAGIVLLMSGFILYDTSRIIHGGETNYLMATVALYLDIYNLFVSLLHLLGALNDD